MPDHVFSQSYAGTHTRIATVDQPGIGGGCHRYHIRTDSQQYGTLDRLIEFQDGPVAQVGVNGLHNEHLLAIVAHRLRGFQSGSFACQQNQIALQKVQEALFWLEDRANDRSARGVDGSPSK